MSKLFLGLDLGTSSVKCAAVSADGAVHKTRAVYDEISLDGWKNAVSKCIRELVNDIDASDIAAVGMSSQVGTYICGDTVIGWNSNAGKAELDFIRSVVTDDEFIDEISMRHPDIISYPLPRLLYIKRNCGDHRRVIMPKEFLIHELTGNIVTDPFSQRGLYNFSKKNYSEKLLRRLDLNFELPLIKAPTDIAGYVTHNSAAVFCIPEGIPVYTGCNDFFAGLLGMGIAGNGDVFDLGGTSEHIGYITDNRVDTDMVSGNYFDGFVTYGCTKSSGVSYSFAMENFPAENLSLQVLQSGNPPIFLPYLNGERAPIFDENARGVFFGISQSTDTTALHYSVLEGIVFSLYDIALRLGLKEGGRLICGGGASENKLITELKAILFGRKIVLCEEPDASALGTAMLSMVGSGVYADLKSAVSGCVKYSRLTAPRSTPDVRRRLLERFELFRSVYRNLKSDFVKFCNIKEQI